MVNNSTVKNKFYFLVTLLFVYVLLFEFVLPVNRILPKPSLLFDSFISVWSDYNLLQVLAVSTTAVYLSLGLGYLTVFIKSRYIIKASFEFSGSFETLTLFKYIPIFFAIVLFSVWFGDSIIAEFIFIYLIVSTILGSKLFYEAKNVKSEYILVGKNLGLSTSKIYSKIIWKASEPMIIRALLNVHFYAWGLVLIYEFVARASGFGGAFRTALLYNDFTALFTFAILITVVIWIGNLLIELVNDKYVVWRQ